MKKLNAYGYLFSIVLALNFLVLNFALANSEDNLLLRYDFNEGRGSAAIDRTGYGADATLFGNAAYQDNTRDPWSSTHVGKFGNSIALDGVGDYLVMESDFHSARLNSDSVGIAAWVDPTASGAGKQYIVSRIDHTAQTGYALAIDDVTGYLRAEVYLDGIAGLTEAVGVTQISGWTHVAMVLDGATLSVYVDGVLDGSTSATISDIKSTSANLTIGALSGINPSYEFSGLIDELRLYSSLDGAHPAVLAAAVGGEPGLMFYESFDSTSTMYWFGGTNNMANLSAADEVEGRFDSALHFQNSGQSNELLSWPAASAVDPDRGHISFWYRPDYSPTGNQAHIFLETDDSGAADGFRIYRCNSCDDGDDEFRMRAKNNYLRSNRQEPEVVYSWQPADWQNPQDHWHRIELIWDLGSSIPSERYMAYVVDGEIGYIIEDIDPIATGAITSFYVGSRSVYSGMEGSIDELKIYSLPQFDPRDYNDRIAAQRVITSGDGELQVYENVYNSADAEFPDSALAAEDPITFYQVAPFDRVYAGTVPAVASISDDLYYKSANNEHESLFFNVYSQSDVSDVIITLSDFKDDNGNTVIDAGELDLRVVKNWWQLKSDDHKIGPYFPVWVPELLMYDDRYNFKRDDYDVGPEADHTWDNLPSFPKPGIGQSITEFRAFTSKQFMVKLHVPDTVDSGNYSATATLTGNGISGSREVTLHLAVRDITLPDPDKTFMLFHRAQYIGSPPENSGRDLVPSQSYYLSELQDIRDHGFNGVFAYGADVQYVTDIAGLGFDDVIMFPTANRSAGLSTAMNNAFGEAWYAGIDEPVTETKLNWQLSAATQIHNGDSANGYVPYGKIGTAIYLHWADCLAEPHRSREHPDFSIDQDFCLYTGDYQGNGVFQSHQKLDLENINVYNIIVSQWGALGVPELSISPTQNYFQGLLDGSQQKDDALQTYYWQMRDEDARVNRYYAGIHLYLTDLAGIFPHVYYHNNGSDPFDDLDNAPTTPGFSHTREMGAVYPTQQGPMSTIEWEALREGVDDYRYLQLWKSLYTSMLGEDPAIAAISKAAIDAALLPFQYRIHTIQSSVNLAEFDSARETVATQIELLQVGLGDPDGDGVTTAAENLDGTDPNHPDHDRDGLNDGVDINPTDRFSPHASGTNLSLVADFSDPDMDDNNLIVSAGQTIYVEVWDAQLNGNWYNPGPSYVDISSAGLSNEWVTCSNTSSNTVCEGSTGVLNLSAGPHILDLKVKTKKNGNGEYLDVVPFTAQ